MAQLAIKGHPTRGKEVIQLLEMLGGKNIYKLDGKKDLWYILSNSTIEHATYLFEERGFTLEEFEEEFPYKVGDKVIVWIDGYRSICNIQNMEWDSIANEIKYKIQDYWYSTINLQPYKEETMEEVYAYNEINCYHQDFGDKVRIRLGNDFEIKVEDNITYIVKKQSQYPKNYEECCGVLGYEPDEDEISCYQGHLIESFVKLLICRDAYWKIAGEQMGLRKPWGPDWCNENKLKYCIECSFGTIDKTGSIVNGCFLAFPTKEMRDAFYENFKDLINETKELL